jgi:hypothetical protein
MVASTFADYDNACLRITNTSPPHRPLFSNNFGWDMHAFGHNLTPGRELRLVRRGLQPREKSPPRRSMTSANYPGSSHQLPADPT